jgi:hypothetical protein
MAVIRMLDGDFDAPKVGVRRGEHVLQAAKRDPALRAVESSQAGRRELARDADDGQTVLSTPLCMGS